MKKKAEKILKIIITKILFLFFRKKSGREKLPKNITSVVFIRLNKIGDALVTTPFLYQLSKNGDKEITIIADKKNYFIFQRYSFIKKIIIYDKSLSAIKNALNILKMADIIIDGHDDISSTVNLFLLLNYRKFSIGMLKNNIPIYDLTIEKLDSTKHHIIERNLVFLKLFNIDINYDSSNVLIYLQQSEIEKAENFIKTIHNKLSLTIGINISAGNQSRFWGVENFNLLYNFLSKNYNVVFLFNPSDINLLKQICNEENMYFYSNTFFEFAAIISKLDLLFTPDTSAIHIASAFSVPVFGLYVKYKTNDIIWYPYKSKFKAIITEEENLNNISYKSVENELKQFLKEVINAKDSKL